MTAAILPFSTLLVLRITAISPSKIPLSIIDKPLTFNPKYFELGEVIEEGIEISSFGFSIASIASPAAIEPINGISILFEEFSKIGEFLSIDDIKEGYKKWLNKYMVS